MIGKSKTVNVLSRLKNYLNLQQKIVLNKSILIEPHFTYCSTVLFLSNKCDVRRIRSLQNKS